MSTTTSLIGNSNTHQLLNCDEASIANLKWKQQTANWTSIRFENEMFFGSRKGEVIVFDTAKNLIIDTFEAFSFGKNIDYLRYLQIFSKHLVSVSNTGKITLYNFAERKARDYAVIKPENSQLVGVCGTENSFAMIYRAQTLQALLVSQDFQHTDIAQIAFHDDVMSCCKMTDKHLIVGFNDGYIQSIELTPQSPSKKIQAHKGPINHIFFDKGCLFSKCDTDQACAFKSWNPESLLLIKEYSMIKFTSPSNVCSLSGKYLISKLKDKESTIEVFDLETGSARTLQTHYNAIKTLNLVDRTIYMSGSFIDLKGNTEAVYSKATITEAEPTKSSKEVLPDA